MKRKKLWTNLSFWMLVLSIITVFLPVISYKHSTIDTKKGYNIFSMLQNKDFVMTVFGKEYQGEFMRGLSNTAMYVIVAVLAIVGAAAIISAFIGVNSMTKQYESPWPFRLALGGAIGTALPSVVLLVLILISKDQFAGEMEFGAYILITPAAMLVACIHTTGLHRETRAEAALRKEAEQYIRPAGDLTVDQGRTADFGQ